MREGSQDLSEISEAQAKIERAKQEYQQLLDEKTQGNELEELFVATKVLERVEMRCEAYDKIYEGLELAYQNKNQRYIDIFSYYYAFYSMKIFAHKNVYFECDNASTLFIEGVEFDYIQAFTTVTKSSLLPDLWRASAHHYLAHANNSIYDSGPDIERVKLAIHHYVKAQYMDRRFFDDSLEGLRTIEARLKRFNNQASTELLKLVSQEIVNLRAQSRGLRE